MTSSITTDHSLQGTFSDSDSEVGLDGNIYEKQGYVIKSPNLRKLSIKDLYINRGPLYFHLLLKPLHGTFHDYLIPYFMNRFL